VRAVVEGRLPRVNELLEIVVEDGRAYRSRVEGAHDGQYMVAAPIGAGDLEVPHLGGALLLAWIVDRSRFVLPVRWLGLTRERPPRWHVEIAGEPRVHCRRRFVRGGGGEPVRLRRVGVAVEKNPLTGEIIDISESAMRLRAADPGYDPGEHVKIGVDLRGTQVETLGRIQTIRSAEDSAIDLVVDFDLREEVARAIRRYVFQRQLAERRARLQTA
jgi:hypothetical protein